MNGIGPGSSNLNLGLVRSIDSGADPDRSFCPREAVQTDGAGVGG